VLQSHRRSIRQDTQLMSEHRVVPRALSTTHEHLLAVIATEALSAGHSHFNLLDAGCGNGQLISYLLENIPVTSGSAVDVSGFDVLDDGVQRQGFLDAARATLSGSHPEIDWQEHVLAAATSEPWPFPKQSFDIVVSNQVCEHVADLNEFFSENARVLRNDGVAIHLFPLRDYLLEGHLLLPLVHRIASHDLRRDFIAFLSKHGVGKYRDRSQALETYAEQHADYLQGLTHYRSWSEVAEAAKSAGLRASYRYTPEYYWRRLARVRGRDYPYILRTQGRALSDAIWFRLLKRISSVTIVLQKRYTYAYNS